MCEFFNYSLFVWQPCFKLNSQNNEVFDSEINIYSKKKNIIVSQLEWTVKFLKYC